MEESAVSIEVKVEDAVIILAGKIDIVEVLKELAKKTDNTIDDQLVQMVSLAKGQADWKGYAKGIL